MRSEAEKIKAGYGSLAVEASSAEDGGMDIDDDEEDETGLEQRRTAVRCPIPEQPGSWASSVRIIDPKTADTVDVLDLDGNDAALCCCAVQFHSRGGEVLLAVGGSTEMKMNPVSTKESFVALYRIVDNRLTLLHRTKVDGIVVAMTQFQGKLLIGCGGSIKLYDMGKKQLLMKTSLEIKERGMVKTLQAAGDRVYVGDVNCSVSFIKFDASQNKFHVFCDDSMQPRHIVAQELLDVNTVIASDKFGNIFVLRAPKGAVEETVSINAGLWESGTAAVTAGRSKFEVLCHYYAGEIVTGLKRASLIAGGSEAVVYTTVSGKIGALLPIKTRDDVEFFSTVERELRLESSIVGRDQGQYRSMYAPVKACGR